MPNFDPEMLAIGRIRKILSKLEPHQRLQVIQYVGNGEMAAQNAAEQATVHRAADALGLDGAANQGTSGAYGRVGNGSVGRLGY